MRTWFHNRGGHLRRHLLLQQLEDRVVLDASVDPVQQDNQVSTDCVGVADPVDNAAGNVPATTGDGAQGGAQASSNADSLSQVYGQNLNEVLVSNSADQIQSVQATATAQAQESAGLNVVLISNAVSDAGVITDAVTAGTHVLTYDAQHDNLGTIQGMLDSLVQATGQKVGHLAVVGHGQEGVLTIGSDQIDFFSLSNYRSTLISLGADLTASAQIQLYGCSVASNVFGQALIDSIATYTGADVFASSDVTGGLAHDWQLEYSSNAGVTISPILTAEDLAAINSVLAVSEPQLLKDISQTGGYNEAMEFTNLNGTLFFRAQDPVNGYELWKSDGTADGTVLVMDIYPGMDSSYPQHLTVVGNKLYFVADDGQNGSEVWESDGTPEGTHLTENILPEVDPPIWAPPPSNLTNVNGTLFFTAFDDVAYANTGSLGHELFYYDPVLHVNQMIDVGGPNDASNPWNLTVVGTDLYFGAFNPTYGHELWKYTAGPNAQLAADIWTGTSSGYVGGSAMSGALLFFSGTDGGSAGTELWSYNPFTGASSQVADINATASSMPENFINVGCRLYFTADDGAHGRELWTSNGTPEGTVMLADVNGTSSDSGVTELTNVNGTLYFKANPNDSTSQLWKSDGTPATTQMVTGIDRYAGEFTNVNGTLFFTNSDATYGYELWKHDPTTGVTGIVKDIRPGSDGGYPYNSYPSWLAPFGDILVFSADDGTHSREFWRSDGTSGGTYMVKDMYAGSGGLPWGQSEFVTIGDYVYFTADDGTHGAEVWRTDGTAEGTVMVADVNPTPSEYSPHGPHELTEYNGNLYFIHNDDVSGMELWRHNPVTGVTELVKDIVPGSGWSWAHTLFKGQDALGNDTYLYFISVDATWTEELWRTDGTTAGTITLTNLSPQYPILYEGTQPELHFANFNGYLYFAADDGVNGTEIWKTNGTVLGTQMVTDFFSGAGSSNFTDPVVLNNYLYFAAVNTVDGCAVWRMDTSENIVKIADPDGPTGSTHWYDMLTVSGGNIYFSADDGTNGTELWKIDGTTGASALVKDINTSGDSYPHWFTDVNGTLYFAAYSPDTGVELWKSNGTSSGTELVKNIFAGAGSSDPQSLINLNGQLAFVANDGIHGYEPWLSDGTADGTAMRKDIFPGIGNGMLASSSGMGPVQGAAIMNGSIYFMAYDPQIGLEPWVDGTVNDAPVNTVPESVTATVNTLTPVTGITIADSDAGSSVVQVTLGVAHGTLQVSGIIAGGLTAGQISGNGTSSVVLNGTLAQIDATLADVSGLQYQSVLNYTGSDTLTVSSNDLGASGSGGPLTTVSTVPMTVSSWTLEYESTGWATDYWRHADGLGGYDVLYAYNSSAQQYYQHEGSSTSPYGNGASWHALGDPGVIPAGALLDGSVHALKTDGTLTFQFDSTYHKVNYTSTLLGQFYQDFDHGIGDGLWYQKASSGTTDWAQAGETEQVWFQYSDDPNHWNLGSGFEYEYNPAWGVSYWRQADGLGGYDVLFAYAHSAGQWYQHEGTTSSPYGTQWYALGAAGALGANYGLLDGNTHDLAAGLSYAYDGMQHRTYVTSTLLGQFYYDFDDSTGDGLWYQEVGLGLSVWAAAGETEQVWFQYGADPNHWNLGNGFEYEYHPAWGVSYWRQADGLGGYDVLFAYAQGAEQWYQHEGTTSSPYGTQWYTLGAAGALGTDYGLLDGNTHQLAAGLSYAYDGMQHRTYVTSTLLGQFYYDFDDGTGDGLWYQKVGSAGQHYWVQAGESEQVWFQYGADPNHWNLGNGFEYEYNPAWGVSYWRQADGLGGYDVLFAYAHSAEQWYQNEGTTSSPYGTQWYTLGAAGALGTNYGLLDGSMHQLAAGLTYSYDGMQQRAYVSSTLLGQFYYDFDHSAGDGLWYQQVGPGPTDWAQAGETAQVWFEYGATPYAPWDLGNGFAYEYNPAWGVSYWRHADGLGGYDVLYAYAHSAGQWYQNEGTTSSPYGAQWYTLGAAGALGANYGLLDGNTHQLASGLSYRFDAMQHRTYVTSTLLGQFYYDFDDSTGDGLWYQKIGPGPTDWAQAGEAAQVWFQYGADPNHWDLGNGFAYEYQPSWGVSYWRHAVGLGEYDVLFAYAQGAGQWYQHEGTTTSPYGTQWYALGAAGALGTNYGLLDGNFHEVADGLTFGYNAMDHRAFWMSDLMGQFFYDFDHGVGDGLWYQYQPGSASWLPANETEQVWFQYGADPNHWTVGSGFEYEYFTAYATSYWRQPIGGATYTVLYAYSASTGQWYQQTTPTTNPYGDAWVTIPSRPTAIG